MLQRFHKLQNEVALISKTKDRTMLEMEDETWPCDIAFLIDITTSMNEIS